MIICNNSHELNSTSTEASSTNIIIINYKIPNQEEKNQQEEEEDRTFIIRDDTVSGGKNISFPLDRKQPTKTAQDDMHLGLVHEW